MAWRSTLEPTRTVGRRRNGKSVRSGLKVTVRTAGGRGGPPSGRGAGRGGARPRGVRGRHQKGQRVADPGPLWRNREDDVAGSQAGVAEDVQRPPRLRRDVVVREGYPDRIIAGDGMQRPEHRGPDQGSAVPFAHPPPCPRADKRRFLQRARGAAVPVGAVEREGRRAVQEGAHDGASSMTRRRLPLQVRTSSIWGTASTSTGRPNPFSMPSRSR